MMQASSFQSRDDAALKTMKLIHSESQRQGGLHVLLLTVKATTVCLSCAKHPPLACVNANRRKIYVQCSHFILYGSCGFHVLLCTAAKKSLPP